MTTELIVVIHAAATWFMTGLIWFVQVVHYPLFAGVGSDQWPDYHGAHSSKTTKVVAAPMLIEVATGVWLAVAMTAEQRGLPVVGLGLLTAIWLTTVLRQIPDHQKLAAAVPPMGVSRLVRGNSLRVVLWSARALVVGALLIIG